MRLYGAAVWVVAALILILIVRRRARCDHGMRERRMLEPQDVRVWEWFADFERRGGRVQDTEGLGGIDRFRARSVPWRASAQLILLMLISLSAWCLSWSWWAVVAYAFAQIVGAGLLGQYNAFLRNDEIDEWHSRGTLGWIVLGLALKAAVLCLGLYMLRWAAAVISEKPSLLGIAVVMLIVGVVLIDRAHLPARAIETRLRRRASASFSEATPGSTILYLRSFDDDTVRIFAPLATWRWYGPFLPQLYRFEEVMESWTYGKAAHVVAIGRPGERRPLLGAERSYWTDETWQEAVRRTVARCRAVVLVAGTSKGLSWEIEQISQMGALGKTLLLLPPDTPERTALRYRTITAAIERPDDPYIDSDLALKAVPAISYTGDGELVHYISFGRDWAAFAIAQIHMLNQLSGSGTFEAAGNLSEMFERVERAIASQGGPDAALAGLRSADPAGGESAVTDRSGVQADGANADVSDAQALLSRTAPNHSPAAPSAYTITREREETPPRQLLANLILAQAKIEKMLDKERFDEALARARALQAKVEGRGLPLCESVAEQYVAVSLAGLGREAEAATVAQQLVTRALPRAISVPRVTATACEVKDVAVDLLLDFDGTSTEDSIKLLEAQYSWRSGLGMGEQAGATAALLALHLLDGGQAGKARRWAERYRADAEARGSLQGQAKALILFGLVAIGERDPAAALAYAAEATAIIDHHTFDDDRADAQQLLARAQSLLDESGSQ